MRGQFSIGAEFDFLSPSELEEGLSKHAKHLSGLLDSSGVKYRRLPLLSGTASGGVLDIGGDTGAGVTWNGNPVGPKQGNAWIIGLLSVNGLTATPVADIVNLYINGAGSSNAWWQFNGANFAYTFGDGQIVLLPGETLRLASPGTIAATGTISLIGSVRSEVPAEKLGGVVSR